MTAAQRVIFMFAMVAAALIVFSIATPIASAQGAEGEGKSDALKKGIQEAAKRYGGCDFDPYPILERYKTGRAVYITPTGSGPGNMRNGIDPALACRLVKMLQGIAQKGCNPRINSAYRSAAHQQSICGAGRPGCAAPGRSCHQYGAAVDLTTDCGGWLRRVAPQFQLHFPYSGIHVQCIEHRTAGASSCNRECNGGVRINPDLSNIPPPSSPTSGLTDAMRQAMNPQQQPQQPAQQLPLQQQQPPQQQPPPLNGQNQTPFPPGTCAPQNYCANSNIYYRESTCVDRLTENCKNGCTGVSCNVSRDQKSDIFDDVFSTSTRPTSTQQLPPPPSPSSAIDKISEIASPTPSPSGPASKEPLVLTIGAEDAVRIEDRGEDLTVEEIEGAAPPPPTQQTFMSEDLRMSPEDTYSPEQRTALQAVLATARETLTYILAYLRPFGRPYQEAIE